MVGRPAQIRALDFNNFHDTRKGRFVAKSGHSAHDPRAWANIVQNRAWWITLLQWTLWGVLMLIIAGWLAKSRFRARPASEARRLVHPPSTLIIGLFALLCFLRRPCHRLERL